jgi:hypothetical protein
LEYGVPARLTTDVTDGEFDITATDFIDLANQLSAA